MRSSKKDTLPALVGIIVIVMLTASAVAVSRSSNKNVSNNQNTTQIVEPNATSHSDATASINRATTPETYKDGTYAAAASYKTPQTTENITVKVTLKNGIISDVSETQIAKERESAEYQAKFASGYKTLVVGKKISQVHLSHVSGSSLTSIGFNDALAQIMTKAQS